MAYRHRTGITEMITLHNYPRTILLLLVALTLVACAAGGDVTRPIPSAAYPAPQHAHRLVVMLPGVGDNLEGLQRRNVAHLIQNQWPDADVILTGLTLPFYKQGRAAQRLHDEVIAPASIRDSSRELWLAGISLGGMGALLYDRKYPDEATGMLLLSPYLGDTDIHKQIRAAGGLAHWNAGPSGDIDANNFQHELWSYLQGWATRPQRSDTVWVAYGASERFRQSIELMTPLLPPDHVIMLPGRHNWDLWQRALPALLQRAGQVSDEPGESHN